ncbi:hypothetical protein Tco_0443066 [Tanacetum coccineum]
MSHSAAFPLREKWKKRSLDVSLMALSSCMVLGGVRGLAPVLLEEDASASKRQDEPREPKTSELREIGHDGSNPMKDLSDESIEPKEITNDAGLSCDLLALVEQITNDAGLSNLGDKKFKDGIEKDNEWIEYE